MTRSSGARHRSTVDDNSGQPVTGVSDFRPIDPLTMVDIISK
jgi:hypothetical protein